MLISFLNNINPRTLFTLSTLMLSIFGLVMVFSSSSVQAMENHADPYFFLKKQTFYLGFGLVLFWISSKLKTEYLEKKYKFFYFIGFFLLALTLIPILSKTAGGASRWIQIAGISLQPIEISKYLLLIFIAKHLIVKLDKINTFKIGIISPFTLTLPYVIVLLSQPDFGNTVLVLSTIFLMIIIAGAKLKHIIFSFILLCISFGTLIMAAPYRMKRLLTFLNPYEDPHGAGYQIIQSYVSFAKGKFLGVGLGNSSQKLFFLPQNHNDFIFSIIAEELGFLGCILTLILFFSLFFSIYKMILRAKDVFCRYLMSGILLITLMQVIINISVTIGLIPTKGVPLPLVSYGGSSLVFTLFSLGIILALDMRKK